jgi:hypothetical protein
MTKISSFPESIRVDVLESTHNDYHAGKIRLYSALYNGGDAIHKDPQVIGKLLQMRQIEKSDIGAAQYSLRKARAHYINRAAGLCDWFTASAFPADPMIETDVKSEYFESLNTDADGLGTAFSTLCRNALKETFLGGRTYFKVHFPMAGDVVAANDLRSLEARLSVVPAVTIDDWEFSEEGKLEWVRAHAMELVRDPFNPFARPTKEKHTWCFYTESRSAIYSAEKDIGSGFSSDQVAMLTGGKEHDFGVPQIFDVRSGRGQFVLDRIYDVIKALFEREAGITWALDAQAYAVPVLTTQDTSKVPSISGSELLAIVLEIGGTYTFSAPPATIFDPLFKDIERLSKDLYEVVQALAINAAALPQSGRLSGESVVQFREPMKALLASFIWPIKEAAKRSLEAIAKYRGENVKINLIGFDEPADVTLEDAKKMIKQDQDRFFETIKKPEGKPEVVRGKKQVEGGKMPRVLKEYSSGRVGKFGEYDLPKLPAGGEKKLGQWQK